MCVMSIDPRRSARAQAGFTLPELVAVLIIVGVLATVALPRLAGVVALRQDSWREEVVAALRTARQTAIAHRRLVCVVVAADRVTLAIAPSNPAVACSAALPGPGGTADYSVSPGGAVAAVVPAGTLYFQSAGRVTSDGAGALASNRLITISGAADIVVVGETGHVR